MSGVREKNCEAPLVGSTEESHQQKASPQVHPWPLRIRKGGVLLMVHLFTNANIFLAKSPDLIDLYFELSGTNMLLKKQIIHIIYNELTASGKLGSSNVNNMFCALEY